MELTGARFSEEAHRRILGQPTDVRPRNRGAARGARSRGNRTASIRRYRVSHHRRWAGAGYRVNTDRRAEGAESGGFGFREPLQLQTQGGRQFRLFLDAAARRFPHN